MARHPGWVRFPARFVPESAPRPVRLGAGRGEAGEDGPSDRLASRPAALGAPPVQRRSTPADRLPEGTGDHDAEHPIAAHLRTGDALDAAASTYLVGNWISAAAAEAASVEPRTSRTGAGNHGNGKALHERAHHPRPAAKFPVMAADHDEVVAEINEALQNPAVKAFLRLLSFEEHNREREYNYRTRYGDFKGKDPITDGDMDDYHAKNMTVGKTTTPAGAYQINKETYEDARKQGIANNFRPESQDKIAVWLLYREHALEAIKEHKIEEAFSLLRKTWSSLPGGVGVKENVNDAKRRYERYLLEEIKYQDRDRP